MDRRIPSLDGARTISIALVTLSHLGILAAVPIIWRFDYGNLGVRVFFVISGFLITSLLIREQEKTGRIDLPNFYIRRFLRLVPAYWAYIALIALMIPTGLIEAKWRDLFPALAYFANYHQPVGALGHTWSLAVEEQFYFLWPIMLVVLGLRKAYRACAVLLLIAPIFRVLADVGIWPSPPKFAFECVCDALAMGCALALFRNRLWEWSPYRQLVSSRWGLLPALGALILIAAQPPPVVTDVIGLPLLNIGVAVALDRYMRFPGARIGRMLNLEPMVWAGKRSYGIYLWQQFWVATSLPTAIQIAAILACATASWDLIEIPFLGLRSKWRATQVSAAVPAL